MRRLTAALVAASSLTLAAAAPAPDDEDKVTSIPSGFYRLQIAAKLPGKHPDWDYLAYDGVHRRLFIARRAAGLWVYDTVTNRLTKYSWRRCGHTYPKTQSWLFDERRRLGHGVQPDDARADQAREVCR